MELPSNASRWLRVSGPSKSTLHDRARFSRLDPAVAGIRLIAEQGGVTPANDEIHLRNNYDALFAQDDWKILKNLTASFGVRWDYDSEFNAKKNFAPRLGITWG